MSEEKKINFEEIEGFFDWLDKSGIFIGCSCITYYLKLCLLQKFLRDRIRPININIEYNTDRYYVRIDTVLIGYYKIYEQALSAGLLEAIKLIK